LVAQDESESVTLENSELDVFVMEENLDKMVSSEINTTNDFYTFDGDSGDKFSNATTLKQFEENYEVEQV